MQCQLLVGALRRRPEFRVAFCSADMNLMLNAIAASSVQVAILNTDHPKNGRPDMTMLRRLHLAHPEGAKILLLGSYDRDLVATLRRQRAVRFCRGRDDHHGSPPAQISTSASTHTALTKDELGRSVHLGRGAERGVEESTGSRLG